MAVNFGLLDPNAFQRGFQQSRAPFEEARQQQEQQRFANALAALQANPGDTNALAQVTALKPELGFKIGQDLRERQREQQVATLTGRAAQGDDAARAQLAGIDFDAWAKLDDRSKAGIKLRTDYIGEAALAVSQLPEAQRAQAWDQYITQGASMGIDGLEQYQGRYSPEGLNAALASAGKVKAFLDTQKIDWKVIPQGGSIEPFSQMGIPLDNSPRTPPTSNGAPAPAGGAQGAFQVVGLPGDQETSGRRSAADNRRVDGVPNSFHLTGQASDRVPPPGMSMAAYAAELQRLNPNLEVINEGDHVHLEPRSRGQFAQSGGVNREQLVAQARDAIAKGADPAAVQARLNQLLGGN